MNLIPPTHGRAGVKKISARTYLEQIGEERVKETMRKDLNRVFQEELGVDAPEGWLYFEVLDHAGDVEIRLSAEAPTQARTVRLATTGEVRTFEVPVSTQSSIRIVTSPYNFDNPYIDPKHHLTFKGWDAETGLMVFDR